MRCRTVIWVFGLLLVLAAGANAPGTAASVLDITLKGAYFSEPATVRFTVAVEPIGQRRLVAPRLQRVFRRQTDRHHCVTCLHRRAGDAVDRLAIDW
jgi:hypothetical protein